MRLVKLLIALVFIHAGLGFTQMVASYYGGGVADYGESGVLSHTPLVPLLNLDDGGPRCEVALSNPRGLLECINNLGDTLNGLASINYAFLSNITADDGFVFNVVVLLRLAAVLFSVGIALALVYVLFDSNLLTSKLGLGLMGLGGLASVTGLAV